jgi:hypothetical protein
MMSSVLRASKHWVARFFSRRGSVFTLSQNLCHFFFPSMYISDSASLSKCSCRLQTTLSLAACPRWLLIVLNCEIASRPVYNLRSCMSSYSIWFSKFQSFLTERIFSMNSYQRTPSFMSCKDESYGGSRASLFIAPISTISQHINHVRPPPPKEGTSLEM